MKTFADKWFDIYYGLMTKKTHISRRNLEQMQYSTLGNVLPEECWITNEIIDEIESKLK